VVRTTLFHSVNVGSIPTRDIITSSFYTYRVYNKLVAQLVRACT
jgi:hypothetical protein